MRETWAFALANFFIDPIWWFFLFWPPGYLGERYGLDLRSFAPNLPAVGPRQRGGWRAAGSPPA
ncbi:hypothetical protein V2S85_26190 [Novosphingobium resinovorum]|nr:hypothetical protein [Novosphingobium resinovorum]